MGTVIDKIAGKVVGAPGPQGDPGPKGDPGASSYHVETSAESFAIHTDVYGAIPSAQEIRVYLNAKYGTDNIAISSVTGLPNIILMDSTVIQPEIFRNAFTSSITAFSYILPAGSQVSASQINTEYIVKVDNGTENGLSMRCALSIAFVKDGATGISAKSLRVSTYNIVIPVNAENKTGRAYTVTCDISAFYGSEQLEITNISGVSGIDFANSMFISPTYNRDTYYGLTGFSYMILSDYADVAITTVSHQFTVNVQARSIINTSNVYYFSFRCSLIFIKSGDGSSGGSVGTALVGKRLSILGDSISAYPGYVTPSSNAVFYPSGNNSPACDVESVEDMWWKIVLNKTGMVLGANNSYSGRTLKNSATTANVEALGANGTPDVILVYLGTNDANQQLTLGTLDTSVPFNVNNSEVSGNETLGTNLTRAQVEALGNTTFYESVRTLIIRLQWYYPAAKIVFVLVGFGSYARFFANNPYRQATIECCELHGVEYIDVRKAGLHMPRLTKYTFQRVHPNKAGMNLIGEYVYNKLVALYGNYMAEIDSDIPVDVTLTGLSYTGTLSHEQFEGVPFDPTGLTFTASFSDGTTSEVDPADLILDTDLGTELTSTQPSYTYNGVTKSTTPIPITVTPTMLNAGGYRFAIRNSFSEMHAKSGNTVTTGVPSGQTAVDSTLIRYKSDSRARRRAACSIAGNAVSPAISGEVIAVTGGATVHLTANPEGFTHAVDWSCSEINASGSYVGGSGIHAEQWLSGDLVLQPTTAYLLICHKPNADTVESSVSFTTAEIALLPGAALSIIESGGEVTLTDLTYTGTLSHEQFEDTPLDPTGLTFTAHFSDGTTATVDPADLILDTSLGLESESTQPSYTYNGVSKSTTPIPITVTHTLLTAGGYRFAVRNSFSEMKCIASAAISMATNSSAGITTPQPDLIKYSEDSRERRRVACAIAAGQTHPAINGEILAVTGGSTIHLTEQPSGFTHPVAWSMMEMDSNLAYVGGNGIRAEQWLEGDRTLQANTAYIQVSCKPKNDTASTPVRFTNAEIQQLPAAALSIQ